MLSYKKPLYDYYVETDLDTVDDQPIDFSKRYADQESYEVCRQPKSTNKDLQFSPSAPPDHSQSGKQPGSDEVRVYCIEGTPITISSASSFCDLRDIGAANLQAIDTGPLNKCQEKACYPCLNNSENSREQFNKKSRESADFQKSILELPKEDAKEGKSVTFRNEDDVSKASSPLMFSRSSSVCSLNSFEQHSIIDDRSSVSVFSALTSGVISPSELPDSPGEAVVPDSTDKSSSPKNISKDDSDNESDNVLELHIKNDLTNEDVHENKSSEQVPDHSLPKLQVSKSKDSIQEQDSLKSEENSDAEENILFQQCIQLVMPTEMPDAKVFVNAGCQTNPVSITDEKVLEQETSLVKSDDEDSEADENDILLQQCIQLGKSNKLPEEEIPSKAFTDVNYQPHCRNVTDLEIRMEGKNLNKSDEDSDADENDMLNQCIQLGMPKNAQEIAVKKFTDMEYHSSVLNNNAKKCCRDNCPDGISDGDDDDDDDDDDDILSKCIRAGMPRPKVVSDVQKRQHISRTPIQKAPNSSRAFLSDARNDCGKKFYSPRLPQNQVYAPVHAGTTWVSNSSFIEVDSMRIYRTEDTPILSPSASLSDLSSLSFNDDKSCHESYLNNSRNSDCSSDSEDDELLLQCIRSGMPGAKRAVA